MSLVENGFLNGHSLFGARGLVADYSALVAPETERVR